MQIFLDFFVFHIHLYTAWPDEAEHLDDVESIT